jgi:hypothetical protein
MGHVSILGMTESGKTSLAKRMAAQYQTRGVKVIILDPLHDPGWPADFRTADAARFLQTVKSSRSCAVFIDESGDFVGRYDAEMTWLGTRARHYGHNCHFISQRAQLISTTVRNQCSYLACFNLSSSDGKLLADEWNRAELKNCNTLKKGEYYWCGRFGDIEKRRLWHDS